MNLEEIKAREQAATQWAKRCDRTNLGCQIPQIIRLLEDVQKLIAEVERLTAENASGREANESCRKYIETLKKELRAAVETADMWTDAYSKGQEENATLKKALEAAIDRALPNSFYTVKQAITRNLLEECAQQLTHETHGNDLTHNDALIDQVNREIKSWPEWKQKVAKENFSLHETHGEAEKC